MTQDGKWSGVIGDVPTGGPYTLELRAAGSKPVAVKHLLVGDLWILGGQSNMEGVADLVDVQAPDPLVNSFDMSDEWINAKEPLHSLPDSVDSVHWRKNAKGQIARLEGEEKQQFIANRKKGAGLGLPFAVELVRRTGVPVGLIPCAHGGTSMDQWSPALKDKAGASLYGATVRRFKAVGGKVAGMLWYQGESDANPKVVADFQTKFEKMVEAFRSDFDQADMPFYWVQIGRHVANTNIEQWNMVQEMQRKAEATISHGGMVSAVDVEIDDGIHVSTQDQKRVGKRLAVLALRDVFPKVQGPKRGPRLDSVRAENGIVKVTFSEVNGKLHSDGRISGFTVHNEKGEPVPAIFKAKVDPSNGSTILLYISGKLPEGAKLHYGYSRDPYCNLRDEADMGVPVFGPVAIR
jgi:sialate O-acetylesterase